MRYAFITAMALLMSQTVWADPPQRTISTTGDAIVYVIPDKVTVTFGVERFDKDLEAAVSGMDQSSASLLKAIKDLGIDDKDMQVAFMNVTTVYDNSSPMRGLAGYKAQRLYVVRLSDVKLFEPLVTTALKSGANEVSNFEFDSTQMRQQRDKARVMAIIAAREKAALLASALNCTIGSPLSITDNTDAMWGYSTSNLNMYQGAAMSFEGGVQPQILPLGQIPIKATVSVMFLQYDASLPQK
jgi:uncharacterized protein